MVSPSSPGSDAGLPPRWRWVRTAGRVATVAVLTLWSVFVAGWLALHWIILPHIDEWRPSIERLATETIGLKVGIGAIEVHSSGWVPALDLRDLRLYDRQGREALHLARVQTALSPQMLLALELRFQQVLIDGARLEVRRDPAGRWHVAGLDWDGSVDSGDTRARDWFLAQQEFVVRNAEIRFSDEGRGTEPLVLTQLDLVLRNGLRSHALRLDATPPAEWGERFTVRGRFSQPLLAPAGELARWSGVLYAEFPRADAAALRRHLSLPLQVADGEGAFRAWLEIDDGVPRQATLDFAVAALVLQLTPALQPLHLQQAQGRIDAQRDAGGVALRSRGLKFQTADGRAWPAGKLDLSWRQPQDLRERWPATHTPVTGGELTAEALSLDLLAQVAESLPLGDLLRQRLGSLAPQGTVDSLRARWEGPTARPLRYQVDARFTDLGMQPAQAPEGPGRPGFQRAQLQLSASESGGELRVSMRQGQLQYPGFWDEPELPVDSLEAELSWRRGAAADGGGSALELKLDKASFANADLAAEFSATWRGAEGEGAPPGRLDLNGRLLQARAERVARYLPRVLDAGARDYVARAVQGGRVANGSFRVRGDLAHFPFHGSREGEFRIVLPVQDLQYAFVPDAPGAPSPWPAMEQVRGELEFVGMAMNLNRLQGRLWGYELRQVQGGIANLSQPELRLQGEGRGPLADVLRAMALAPPSPRSAALLNEARAVGSSQLKLTMEMPLAQPSQMQLRGNLQLPGNELRLGAELPPLLGLRGSIDFNPQGLQLRPLTARLLGGDSSLEGSIGFDGNLRLALQGTATADGLRNAPAGTPLAPLAALGAWVRGQAAWRGNLAMADGRTELLLQSNLVGLQVDLPAPLAKPVAATALPLRLQLSPLVDPAAPGRLRDSLQLEMGDLLKAQYQRVQTGTETTVQRGSLAVHEPLPPLPASGVVAALNLGRIDLEAWQGVAERLGGAAAGPAAGAAGYLPQTLQVRAEELRAGTRFLSRVSGTLVRQGSGNELQWRARLEADQLAGDMEYWPASSAAQAGRLQARLQRLAVPQSEVAQVEQLLAQPPLSVPALDIVVDRFELRGKSLGRLQVQAVNRTRPGRAGAPEWQLDKLSLSMPEAQLDASGRWSPGGARRMTLDFGLNLADSGAFLERLGAGQALRGGKGRLGGQLSWAGSPLTLDYPSMEGRLRLDVDAGQFLHASPGGARLLGVLSLQALQRRLTLDFRDLFQDGFVFDSIEGDVDVAQGVANTRNLRMRGVQATVLMQGSADLLRETQDLRVLIVPNFDATGAALATMAINPAIGLGTLLAQWALREPLQAAGTSELHITGSWADPLVQQVDRKAEAAAAAASAASSPAAIPRRTPP